MEAVNAVLNDFAAKPLRFRNGGVFPILLSGCYRVIEPKIQISDISATTSSRDAPNT
jgi:hypothetical protein